MANYYREIYKMMDKLIHRVLIYDRMGFKNNSKNLELSLLELYILKKVGEGENKKTYELIQEMEMDRGLIASSINKLMALDYIEKKKSQEDGRVYILGLTTLGKEAWDRSLEKQQQLLNFILSDFSLNEEKTILKFLSKVNQSTLVKK